MSGLIIVPQRLVIGEAVRRLVDLLRNSSASDFEGRVLYL